ncbi:MAG TPA: AMP-binding protein [Mycobacteriales bacterium]|nr:AMP-binding protein [Mycobacteriales bacterium]
MWLTQLVDHNRQCRADRLAVVDDRGGRTWRELARRVDNLAAGLAGWGVRPGDRVAVLSADRTEVVETYLALGRLGALFVPLNHGLVPREVAEIAGHARLSAILGERHLLDRLGDSAPARRIAFTDAAYGRLAETDRTEPLPDVQADDLAAILYTSATTGWPKGAVADHRALKDIALGWLAVAGPVEDAVLVSSCPLYHGSVVLSLAYLAAGATLVLVADPTPARVLHALREHRATHVWLVPEMLRGITGGLGDLPHLREILYGAAPLPVEVYAEAARTTTAGFRQVYGVTEVGGPFVTLSPAEHPAPDGPLPEVLPAGRVVPGMSVQIVDPDGEPLPAGGVGELCARGDGVMRGYWNDPGATAAVTVDGWVRTGDLGRLDEDGYLHLLGRKTDMIIRAGHNVYPAEIERVLRRHPGVRDVVVVGRPAGDTEAPVAFVVPAERRPGLAELHAYLAETLADYKRPREVRFLDELPRTETGKIRRRLLEVAP